MFVGGRNLQVNTPNPPPSPPTPGTKLLTGKWTVVTFLTAMEKGAGGRGRGRGSNTRVSSLTRNTVSNRVSSMKQGWKTMALGAPKQFQNVLDPGTSRVYTTRWLKNWTHTAKYNKRLVGTGKPLTHSTRYLAEHACGRKKHTAQVCWETVISSILLWSPNFSVPPRNKPIRSCSLLILELGGKK